MKMLISLASGLMFFLLSFTVLAQTRPGSIRGTVTDAQTGDNLPFVIITITDSNGSKITGGVTDVDGKYNLRDIKPGLYTLKAAAVGYSALTITDMEVMPNIPTIQDIKMRPSSTQLQEVVLTYEAPLIDRAKSSRVTTSEDVRNMAVRDITSVASQSAGVNGNANTSIRGARTEGTVYFIDGVKVNGSLANTTVLTPGPARSWNSSISGNIERPDITDNGIRFQLGLPALTAEEERILKQYENEAYSSIKEIPFRRVTSAPLSTFSSDVDVASYANFRRFVNDGILPPRDAVRIEEMINYFDYDYPDPEEGEVFSSTTELAACPWNKDHKLLRIGIKTRDIPKENLPDNNLVFLIDVSGSMGSADKLPLLQKSLRLLVENLNERDRVAIVVYASATGLVLGSTKGTDKQKILAAIDGLYSGGSTAGGAGIQLAYKVASENFKKGENNRVILATDGDFNVGISSDEDLVRLIEEKRKAGIFLTVLGFGTGNLKDSKMEKLADHGNGNYAYIDNLMEAQKVLVHEMGSTLNTVAKDTKFQIEFNPREVKAYRLIGYENRMLRDEDFNDDTKDAGDVGSGHSVTAVYELVTAGSTEEIDGPDIDPLKYQEQTEPKAGLTGELATLKLRYKAPDSETSVLRTKVVYNKAAEKASADLTWICSVMEVGMLLRDSDYKGDSSYKKALELAREGRGADENGYRAEFIRLVSLVEKLEASRNVGMK
ncbi:MAG: YfbK domain-containing protein [Owenweeksia sp.]